ncbi:PREDICTED: UDP-glycosyltransferase 74G1 [Theobroma cacao]|uniref:Glycosyltransferase n=2 Tax=Theobroma cacao TaxID=3641 RepID=A0AB32VQM8_THECC|nr:PREDICTED: UDP-glycosyltransferase 74G1 [Theobroma cacao]EOX93683.1 UDP-xylose phenolic glycosyltransferase, putative [Theobroma cacao]
MGHENKAKNAHVLIFPYPAQGHINPMLQFAKRLVSKGVKATLVSTVFLSKTTFSDPTSSIDMQTISDGFDEGGYNQAGSPDVYLPTFWSVGSKSLASLIKKLVDAGHPIDAIVYDAFLDFALDVAKQFGIRTAAFFTQACAVNSVYYHVSRGLLQLPLPEPKVSLPGLPPLEVSELPSFVCHHGSYPAWFDVVVNHQFSNINEADWVFLNIFYDLEKEAVDWMSQFWNVMTIGPTIPSMYLDKRLENDKHYGMHLFKPKTSTCMSWLSGKPKSSVVYVSFGSMAELDVEQMAEIAWGLKGSNCYFMWVVRESEEAKLPQNFIEETAEKGLVVSWCPQLEVLSHESIGCFLTHCGFNSVLEALSLGVPLLAMPQWTDQGTNAKYVEDVWEIGMRARPDEENGFVTREIVEHCIKELTEGEKGKEARKNASKWKNLARKAVDEGGRSDKNIDEFVTKLLGD